MFLDDVVGLVEERIGTLSNCVIPHDLELHLYRSFIDDPLSNFLVPLNIFRTDET